MLHTTQTAIPTGHRLCRMARYLGRLVANGWLSRASADAALLLAAIDAPDIIVDAVPDAWGDLIDLMTAEMAKERRVQAAPAVTH